jgi:hypothetical protein
MFAGIETFTPEKSAEILKDQDPEKNRNINAVHVKKMAADMKEKRWQLNGETVKFNGSRLLDGWHRLHACVEAGASFDSLVVRDLDAGAVSTVDTGRRRSLSDVLKMRGLVGVSHATVASALATLWLYRRGTYGRANGARTATHEEAIKLLELEPGLLESLRAGQRVAGAGKLCAPGPFMAFHYLFSQKDATLADVFVEGLVNGVGLSEGEPVLTLRNRLTQERSHNHRSLRAAAQMSYVVKAWNATRKGHKLKVIKWVKDEEFPEVM